MRKGLIIFACGFVAGAITIWSLAEVRGIPGNSTMRKMASPVDLGRPHPPLPPLQQRAQQNGWPDSDTVPVDEVPAALPARANPTGMTDMAQTVLIQHMDPRLRAALNQYSSLDDKYDRSALAEDVANLADDNVPIRDVVEALGIMFHQERSIEVKTDILNSLLNLDDPSSYQLIIQGIDPSQPQELRKAAIAVLGDYDDSWAAPTLQQLLSDGDAEIRRAAQDALERVSDQPAAAIPSAP